MSEKPTYLELERDLQDAEEILDTLRNHKADAIVGLDKVALLRLKEVEDKLYKQIQLSENRLKEIESIYNNVPVGLCILDRDLRFVRVNDHLSKIHGIPAEDHIGVKISELLPDLTGDIEPELRQVLDTGTARMDVELYGETPARPGLERCLLEHWLPLYNHQGEMIGINMVIEEITEQKKYEEKLQHLNSLLEKRVAERTKVAENRADKLREVALQMTEVEEKERQRLARVLHDDLQQLLIGAKFNTHLLSKRLSGEKEIKEEIDEISQILDQSIESSRSLSYELNPPFLHDEGLLRALQWLTDMRHMQGLSIQIQCEKKLPELSKNLKIFLFQAVRELLINIIKHARTDEAELRLSYMEDNLFIEVIDNGKGFDVRELESGGSAGMGLRSIREKLDLMNGKLEISSEPGRGSHFTLQVPVEENSGSLSATTNMHEVTDEETSNPENEQSQIPGGNDKISVLIADDHQVMRYGLVRLLTDEFDMLIVGEAGNGLEALDLAKKVQPDVILMDISMPEMNGIEATRLIHQKYPDIRIIGLSMQDKEEYASLMKKAGAVDFLDKAGATEQLVSAIRNEYY